MFSTSSVFITPYLLLLFQFITKYITSKNEFHTATEFHCWAKRMKVNNKYSNKPYFPFVKTESHISFTLLFFCYEYIFCEEVTAYGNFYRVIFVIFK